MKILYLGAAEGLDAAKETISDADVVAAPADAETVALEIKDADAVLDASMKVKITDDMIRAARNLKIISCATTGSDHISRTEIGRRGIKVRTLKEDRRFLMNLTPAAELSWGLVLACARKIPAAAAHTTSGLWVREDFPGVMLHGKRLGLIGCGRIGGWMARYGRAFNMDVVGYDPYLEEFPEQIQSVGLEDLAGSSDVISVHVHLTDDTRNLVSADVFNMMKRGVIFINTSRGGLIDEAALLEGLETGRIRAAGLDVLDGEPEIENHPLVVYARSHDNLIITPHIGGFSPDAVRIVCAHAARKIQEELGIGHG